MVEFRRYTYPADLLSFPYLRSSFVVFFGCLYKTLKKTHPIQIIRDMKIRWPISRHHPNDKSLECHDFLWWKHRPKKLQSVEKMVPLVDRIYSKEDNTYIYIYILTAESTHDISLWQSCTFQSVKLWKSMTAKDKYEQLSPSLHLWIGAWPPFQKNMDNQYFQ